MTQAGSASVSTSSSSPGSVVGPVACYPGVCISICGGLTGIVSGTHPGISRQIVIDIFSMTTYHTNYCFKRNRVKFSATMIPAYWHISALTGLRNDMLRTKRMKDMDAQAYQQSKGPQSVKSSSDKADKSERKNHYH